LQIYGDLKGTGVNSFITIMDGREGLNGDYYKHYTSTYCIHGDHSVCRMICKTCSKPCLCYCHRNQVIPSVPPAPEGLKDLLAKHYGTDSAMIQSVLNAVNSEEDKLEACGTCGMGDLIEKERCPKSKLSCGHHCNHIWTHDECDWCKKTFGPEDSEV
jgi:hypothetical protein